VQGQQSVPIYASNALNRWTTDRETERNISDRSVSIASQSEAKERNGEPSTADRGTSSNNAVRSSAFSLASRLVGFSRISLGIGAG